MNVTTHFPKLVYEYIMTSKRNEAWPRYKTESRTPVKMEQAWMAYTVADVEYVNVM